MSADPTSAASLSSLGLSGKIVSPKYAKNNPRPRKFAPLNPNKGTGGGRQVLKGIIFDVDGTLCLPQNYMFKQMRAALGIPKSVDILEHIRTLSNEPDVTNGTSPPSPPQTASIPTKPPSGSNNGNGASPTIDVILDSPQARAVAKIRAIEREAMTSQEPQPGLQELMNYLTRRGVPKALCTRNFPAPVHNLLGNHLQGHKFDPIITRETEGIQPKPSPEGLWKIAQAWGLDKELDKEVEAQQKTKPAEIDPVGLVRTTLGAGLIMVGDSIDDMAAGYRAGAATVLLVNAENQDVATHEYTDLVIKRLDELVDILEDGFVGKA